MGTIHVERQIAADPVSTALLLTSPSAPEWWPGLHVTDRSGSRLRAVLSSHGDDACLELEALPPRRTPTSFIAHFTVYGGPFDPDTGSDGTVVLSYAQDGTHVAFTLDDPQGDLEADARRFVANLARAAERRASAA